MRKIIAKIFGLKNEEEHDNKLRECKKAHHDTLKGYYQKVVNEMARTGTIPPNCDLQLPKKSMIVLVMTDDDNVKGEVIAKDGRWLRLPNDREKVIIRYQ